MSMPAQHMPRSLKGMGNMGKTPWNMHLTDSLAMETPSGALALQRRKGQSRHGRAEAIGATSRVTKRWRVRWPS